MTSEGSSTIYHVPALLRQSIDALEIHPDGIYADATFGGGGHSRAILAALGREGRLLGFDQDMDAKINVPDDPRFTFVLSNFRYMRNFMRYYGIQHFDGILADLGVSFHHFDDSERGFSFRTDAPLDMRMNRKAARSAKEIVNESDPEKLKSILQTYTDLRGAGRIAEAIIKARGREEISTTGALMHAVEHTLNPRSLKKDLAQVFQAFRIAVNGEMEALEKFLLSTTSMLRPGGRLAVLTYHSIEDRMVKNFMRTGNIEGREEKDFYGKKLSPWRLITRQPIVPEEEEVERNPRSRSAKLRVAELACQLQSSGNASEK